MRNKFILLVLLFVLILVACGADEEPEPTATPIPVEAPVTESEADLPAVEEEIEQVTVRFAVYDVEQGRYGDLIDAFEEENPDVDIKPISVDEILELEAPGDEWPEDGTRRLVSAADVSTLFYNEVAHQQGLLLDLNPFMEADPNFAPEDFQPGLLEYYQSDGATWAVPTEANYMMIYYSKDLFDEAGVDYPEPGWSWEDFLATAEALTVRDGDEVAQWGFTEISSNPILFMESRVGPIFDMNVDPPAVNLDDEQLAEAFQWYVDLYEKYEVAPYFPAPEDTPGTFNVPEGYMLIEQGNAAMWPETIASFPYRSQQMNLGVVPLPVAASDSQSSRLFPSSLAVSVGTANPEAAWRWVDFLSRQSSDLLAIFGGRGSMPARTSVAEASGYWDEIDEDLGTAMRFAVDHAYTATAPQNGYGPFFDAFAAVMIEDDTVESALANAQIAVEDAVSAEVSGPDEDAEEIVVAQGAAEEDIPEDAVTVEFMAITNPLNNQLFRDLAKQFREENPDIVVEIKPPDILTGTPTMLTLAEASDCFQWFPGNFHDPTTQDAILSIDPFLDADTAFDEGDFYPVILQGFQAQGQTWGLPGEITIPLIEYNKDLFDAAGLDYPTPEWTTDDFLALAVELTNAEEPAQFGYVPNVFEAADMLIMADRLGANFIDETADPPATSFDDPQTIDAVRWFSSLTTEHEVKPLLLTNPTGAAATAVQQQQSLLAEGRAGMWTNNAIQVNLGGGQERSYETGAVPLPFGSGTAKGSGYQNSTGYFISSTAETPVACWEWIKYLSAQPTLGSGLPARQSVAESDVFRQQVGDEIATAYLTSMEGVTEPSFSQQIGAENSWLGYPIYWFYGAYEQILNGEASVEEALQNAQALSDEYRACMIAAGDLNDELSQKNCMQGTDETLPDFLFPVSE